MPWSFFISPSYVWQAQLSLRVVVPLQTGELNLGHISGYLDFNCKTLSLYLKGVIVTTNLPYIFCRTLSSYIPVRSLQLGSAEPIPYKDGWPCRYIYNTIKQTNKQAISSTYDFWGFKKLILKFLSSNLQWYHWQYLNVCWGVESAQKKKLLWHCCIRSK